MSEKLAVAKGFKAKVHGFSAVLHTWGQQMQFHPHIHLLVPGAGLEARGRVVVVRKADYLLHLPQLQGAFREHFKSLLLQAEWEVDPAVWRQRWGVHIQPAGCGRAALKYLGRYVARSVISDARIRRCEADSVTFAWKDRADGNRVRELTLSGREFVRRYLSHVLPRGLRSIRYYGYCHPAAVRHREQIQMHTGATVHLGAKPSDRPQPGTVPQCPACRQPMRVVLRIPNAWSSRAPPRSARRSQRTARFQAHSSSSSAQAETHR
jgi:hypothetical protein